MQETMACRQSSISHFSNRWDGKSFWSPALGKQGGVAILVSKNSNLEVLSWRRDSNGRVLSLLIKSENNLINLVNIYAPVVLSDRKEFFDSLHDFFFSGSNLVIGGDFNCYDSPLDKLGGNINLQKELSDFKSDFHLIDIWRKKHPKERHFTWFNFDFKIACRLDKFLVSKNVSDNTSVCNIFPCVFSDHDFVSLCFNLSSFRARGPGVWKFNNSLLQDLSFQDVIRKSIDDHIRFQHAFFNIKEWWDFLKRSLKEQSIAFAKQKRAEISRERVFLTNKLITLKRRLVNENVQQKIIEYETKLKALIEKETAGAKVRSRAQFIEEGEKPTSFFFRLERIRDQKHAVTSILNKDGKEVNTQREIEQAHVDFYSNLYADSEINDTAQHSLLAGIPRVLLPVDSDCCEGEIALHEATRAIKDLRLNKVPGPDGLTVEFYKCFWDVLGPKLVDVVNTCFGDEELTESMKNSVTRILFKKGDRKDLKNWRPISLLNVDYKIASKVLSSRLSKVLETIIDPDQTCSIPGRTISSNLHALRDILDYIERTDETGILISLDQEKAFDRVNRTFLQNLFEKYSFGSDFRKWIRTLYKDANMRVIVNEFLTDRVELRRGVRQGDSLSPLLYVLCVETLACQIRNNPDIEGFLLPGAKGLQYKVGQCADDTTSFVKNYRSLLFLFSAVKIYELGSGAKLNLSKTEAMWLGAWKSRDDQPLGLTWVKKMKILGVIFGSGVEQDNWLPKLKKLEAHLNLWKRRSLSLVGRALLVNALGLSKLNYLATVLIVPNWVKQKVNSLIWPFLWRKKFEPVSRQTCFCLKSKGGLGIVNFIKKSYALKISSVVKAVQDTDTKCFYLLRYFLGGRLAGLRGEWKFLRDNISPSALSLTSFYDQVFSKLCKIRDLCSNWETVSFSSKNVYSILLSEHSSSPLLPYVWQSRIVPNLSLTTLWQNIRDGLTENYKCDLSWLISLRAVTVRDTLRTWGYLASDQCFSCPRRETIDHCFLHCPRVKRVWSFFNTFLSRFLKSVFIPNVVYVFFFMWEAIDAKHHRILLFLVKTILYAVWRFRSRAAFRNLHDDSAGIINYIKKEINFRLQADFLILKESKFKSIWCASPLCRLVDNKPVVSFN